MNRTQIATPLSPARTELPQGTLDERITLAEQRLVAREQALRHGAQALVQRAQSATEPRRMVRPAVFALGVLALVWGAARLMRRRSWRNASRHGHGRVSDSACRLVGVTVRRGALGARGGPALAALACSLERTHGSRYRVDSRGSGPAVGRAAVQQTRARALAIPAFRLTALTCACSLAVAPLASCTHCRARAYPSEAAPPTAARML